MMHGTNVKSSKETSHTLWNPKLHDMHHLFPVLRHMNLVYNFTSAIIESSSFQFQLSDR
jgi:hypothetical protein